MGEEGMTCTWKEHESLGGQGTRMCPHQTLNDCDDPHLLIFMLLCSPFCTGEGRDDGV